MLTLNYPVMQRGQRRSMSHELLYHSPTDRFTCLGAPFASPAKNPMKPGLELKSLTGIRTFTGQLR